MKPPIPLSDTNAVQIAIGQLRLVSFRTDPCDCWRCKASQRQLLAELLTLHRERNTPEETR